MGSGELLFEPVGESKLVREFCFEIDEVLFGVLCRLLALFGNLWKID